MSMLIVGVLVLMATSSLIKSDSSMGRCLPKDAMQQCYLVSWDSTMVITYLQSDNSIVLMPKANQTDTTVVQKWSIKESRRRNGDYMISSAVSKSRTIHWSYDAVSCTMKGDDVVVDRIRLKFDKHCYTPLAMTYYQCGMNVIDKCECEIGFNENRTEIIGDDSRQYDNTDNIYEFSFKFECGGASSSPATSINLLGSILLAIAIAIYRIV